MPSIWETHVRPLASDLGQATRFDSSVGVPMLEGFSGALNVRGRVSNPRSIALSTCNPSSEH